MFIRYSVNVKICNTVNVFMMAFKIAQIPTGTKILAISTSYMCLGNLVNVFIMAFPHSRMGVYFGESEIR